MYKNVKGHRKKAAKGYTYLITLKVVENEKYEKKQ